MPRGVAVIVVGNMLIMEPEGLSQLYSQGLPAAPEGSSKWAKVHPGFRIKMQAVKVGSSCSGSPALHQPGRQRRATQAS